MRVSLPTNRKMRRDHVVTKSFSYSKDDVTLAFSLRVDNKSQLKAFEELLVEALAEVREEIKK
jgi:hypothetical protein